ncbi:hypothetical protein ACPXCP_26725 [Streptomyces sp. DT20]|uniref:hypothetical protein n=1 Tax=Streptomyces sp. DT20 TaxID=3416519 RepID=UPI003CF3C8C6
MTEKNTQSPNIEQWEREGHRTIIDIADMLGVPSGLYSENPLNLIPALQNYASRLPLGEFEESDWVTLQTDLMSYVADFLIQRHGAHWTVADDPTNVRGYRYVIESIGLDGKTRRIDPNDIVREECRKLPIEITRMLASAELTLRLTREASELE